VRITAWLRSLDPDGLAGVCRSRADVCERPVETIEELARQLSTADSVAAAIAGLDRDALLVAQSAVVLGDGCDVGRMRAFVRDPNGVLDATLTRLADRALIWPGERQGTLRFSAALKRQWRYPLDLGTPAWALADAMTKDPVRAVARRLGIKAGSTRDDAARNVAAALADARVVAEAVAKASPEARALLDDLAYRPRQLPAPAGSWEADRYGYRPSHPRDAAEQLYDLGLLLARSSYDSAELPRETALVLRGTDWGPVLTGPPAAEAATVDTAGAEMTALAAVDVMVRLLARVERTPLPVLKKGGVGQRDLRRLAGEIGADHATATLWLALADRAGLVGLGEDGYLPTRRYDDWRADEAYAQWSALAGAWWQLGQRRTYLAPPPVASTSYGSSDQDDAGLRQGVMTLLAELPAGSATGDLAAAMAWRLPAAITSPARVAAVLTESELLGLTVRGALSPLGRALVEGRPEQAASALFPTPVSTVVLQADLTALAAGPTSARTAATLDRVADREGPYAWRFSRESVRRALDRGHTGDNLLATLEAVAVSGVPQPLAYLVRDVARVHGRMRVSACGCCVVSDDAVVIEEIVALNLGLRRVAPTVAVGRDPAPVILAALRGAGYGPVADPAGDLTVTRIPVLRAPAAQSAPVVVAMANGVEKVIDQDAEAEAADPRSLAVMLHRGRLLQEKQIQRLVDLMVGAGDGMVHTQLPDSEVRLLAEAAECGDAVLIEYEKGFSINGRTSLLELDELHIEPRRVVAWCRTWGTEESFPLYTIRSVKLA
jgi:Helicase conserved C-terminal domain